MRGLPRDPLALARFARIGTLSVRHANQAILDRRAGALLAGAAAHSMEPLTSPLTSAFGLLLTAMGHGVGWPVVEGGSEAITSGLAAEVRRLGGVVHTGRSVTSLPSSPRRVPVLLDVTPRQFVSLAGPSLSRRAGRPWARFRPGPGACKVDWALDGPVPWSAEACRRTGERPRRRHLRGSGARRGRGPCGTARGPSLRTGGPAVRRRSDAGAGGRQTLWAYCHVPNGSGVDMAERMETQIERFAPGFRDLMLARTVRTASTAESHNPNLLGGDVNGVRPPCGRPCSARSRWNPYRTPVEGVYLCSASTPPGGGVHGMCGVSAAEVGPAGTLLSSSRWREGCSGCERRAGQVGEEVPGLDLVGNTRLEIALRHDVAQPARVDAERVGAGGLVRTTSMLSMSLVSS